MSNDIFCSTSSIILQQKWIKMSNVKRKVIVSSRSKSLKVKFNKVSNTLAAGVSQMLAAILEVFFNIHGTYISKGGILLPNGSVLPPTYSPN